jgi:hypothetical protein
MIACRRLQETLAARQLSEMTLSGTGTPACADFVALTPGAQPRVAVPPDFFRRLLKTNAPYFRDSAIAMGKPESEVLLRREDSSFRQIGRLTDLLLKLKREARQAQNSAMNIENEGTSHDVVDNKGRGFLIPRCA